MITAKPIQVFVASRRIRRLSLRAFSLVEVLIAVTLMSVIVIGLMATFSQTQRAFRSGMTQVGTMEGGRAALDMLAREIEQASPTRLGSNSFGFFTEPNPVLIPLIQNLPGGTRPRTNTVETLLFASRDNQSWAGIGYRVETNDSPFIGTLYRYETNAPAVEPERVAVLTQYAFNSQPSRLVDDVVHFRVLTYDRFGVLITPYNWFYWRPDKFSFVWTGPGAEEGRWWFLDNAMPAYVEIELGILDGKTADRARNLPAVSQQAFLKNQVGHVQLFRQRIPIRNVDPTVYQ